MVEHCGEITPVDERPQAEPAAGVSKIQSLEDEEDEIDKKIDDLLAKRKDLMGKLAQLIADEKSSSLVDSGVQTAIEDFDRSGDSAEGSNTGSLFSFGRSKSKGASAAAGTMVDTSVGSDDPNASFERRKRKKSLMESLKSALSKAARHIKNRTKRSSKDPNAPEVTVDVGLKTAFGDDRRTSMAVSEHSEGEDQGEGQGEGQGEDLSKELAELNALAGMAIQQRMEDQGLPVSEEQDQQILEDNDQHNTSIADELANLSALADSAIEAAQGPATEPLGFEGDPVLDDQSITSPLASELQGMLNQISSIGMGSDYDTGIDTYANGLDTATGSQQQHEEPDVPSAFDNVVTFLDSDSAPAPAAFEQDVEESGVGMLNAQLSAMLSQIGNLDSGLTVTGAGDC